MNTMTQPPESRSALVGAAYLRWVMPVVVALAAGMAWQAWRANTTMACRNGQWPPLAICADIVGSDQEQRMARLRSQIDRNPGDSRAAVDLAVYLRQSESASESEKGQALERATVMAPNNRDVLRLHAADALLRQAWSQALDALVVLAQHHRDAPSIQVLADLVGRAPTDPNLQTALLHAVDKSSIWLEPVLQRMVQDKVPLATAMPLVNRAIVVNGLPGKAGQLLVPKLKAEGLWLEAYAVWAHLWKRPMPLLFNGDFELPFIQGGFDWEVNASRNDHRSGALVTRVGRRESGQVLQVEFSGKEIRIPVVQQDLMLPPGTYRLKGAWQSRDLHSAQGLTWAVSCAKSRAELARTAPMKATGRDWQTFDMEWTVPSECAMAVTLGLQPHAAYESRTGMRGEIVFDRMEITRQGVAP